MLGETGNYESKDRGLTDFGKIVDSKSYDQS